MRNPSTNIFVMAAAFLSILLLMVARHHRRSGKWRVYWDSNSNTTMLRSVFSQSVDKFINATEAKPKEKTKPTEEAATVTPFEKQNIVIVIPYRDRAVHYNKIMEHLPTITRENWHVHTILVEQYDNSPFRRAWLMNIGIAEAKKRFEDDKTCVVTHDVDMIADSKVDYGWCDRPTQICSELSCFNGEVPYPTSGGGVVQASLKDWYTINGFTNIAIGWGGEDDDLHHRFRLTGLLTGGHLRRPSKGFGKCHCMHDNDHTKRVRDAKGYNAIVAKIGRMQRGSDEWKTDGLNSLKYYVLKESTDKHGSIHLKVTSNAPKHQQQKDEYGHIDEIKTQNAEIGSHTDDRAPMTIAKAQECNPVSLNGFQKFRNGKANFKNWKPVSFKTCAVVGSGASMLGSKCGASIDTHDAVFRINGAATLGFEKDVGHVKTFDVSYSPHCARESQPSLTNIICVHSGGTGAEMEIFNRIKEDIKLHYKKYVFWNFWNDYTKLKHPNDLHFYQHATTKALSNYDMKVSNPTSGFAAILSAFDMCEHVDIYGFDLLFGKNYKRVHYYDFDERDYDSSATPHSFSREGELLKQYIVTPSKTDYTVPKTITKVWESMSRYPIEKPKNLPPNYRGHFYISIAETKGIYYMMVNLWNRGNILFKSEHYDSFNDNNYVIFSKSKNKFANKVDIQGCISATMMLFSEAGRLFYVGSSAPTEKKHLPFCDGHHGGEINTTTLQPISAQLVLKENDLDTQPSIVKYKNMYYKYSRFNNKKTHRRWEKLWKSTTLYDNEYREGELVSFPYDIYTGNIFQQSGTFHAFFWAYDNKKGFQKNYNNMFLIYATSTDASDFSKSYKTIFKGRNVMPVNGHVVKNGVTYVYFLDYTENPSFVFVKPLSEFALDK